MNLPFRSDGFFTECLLCVPLYVYNDHINSVTKENTLPICECRCIVSVTVRTVRSDILTTDSALCDTV
jgi:hypothetical protein